MVDGQSMNEKEMAFLKNWNTTANQSIKGALQQLVASSKLSSDHLPSLEEEAIK